MSSTANDICPQKSLGELKIRSRILTKAANSGRTNAINLLNTHSKSEGPFQHKDGLKTVARLAGFKDWQHASLVLSGGAKVGEDMGSLWYSPKCGVLLNIWCRDYKEAKEQYEEGTGKYLFPYKSQFLIVEDDFLRTIGLDPDHAIFSQPANRNFVQSYGSPDWDLLVFKRLQDAMARYDEKDSVKFA